MIRSLMLVTLACITIVPCSVSILSAVDGIGTVRGDYPRCQQTCLSRLEKNMDKVSDTYSRDKNKILYEEQVEEATLGYDRCIEGCKIARPVK